MTTPSPDLTATPLPSLSDERLLRTAVAAYLSPFQALSRMHAESDLRAFLGWCAERRLDPLAASRPQIELYVRWMQQVRQPKPSTTARRTSIVAGFYRTAVIDGLLEHSAAEHLSRPHVPAGSPTLGRRRSEQVGASPGEGGVAEEGELGQGVRYVVAGEELLDLVRVEPALLVAFLRRGDGAAGGECAAAVEQDVLVGEAVA